MPKNYDQIIDKLSEDPEFLDLPSDDQDRLIEELAQEKMGAVPSTENFLQRAVRGMTAGTMIGGPSLGLMAVASDTPRVEEGLPDAAQLIGNMIGGEVGLTTSAAPIRGAMVGGTLGRSVGEFAKQVVQRIVEGKPTDPKELGIQSLIGAGTEAIGAPFALAINKFFGKFAGKEFKSKVGPILGALRKRLQESGASIPVEELSGVYRQIADDLASKVKIHPDLAKIIYGAADDLERVASTKGGVLGADDILRSEKYLSNNLKGLGVFGETLKKGDYSDVGELIGAKEAAGKAYQGLAESQGIGKQMTKAKNVYSKISQDYSTKSSKHGILKNILEAGGIHSLMRGQGAEAVGNILASEAVGSNPLFNSIYNILKVGKAAPTAIAGGINFLRDQLK